jgi:hypothetical protein
MPCCVVSGVRTPAVGIWIGQIFIPATNPITCPQPGWPFQMGASVAAGAQGAHDD